MLEAGERAIVIAVPEPELSEDDLGLGSQFAVALPEEFLEGFLEHLPAAAFRAEPGLPVVEEEAGSVGVAWPQAHRLRIKPLGGAPGVEGGGSIASIAEREAGALCELARILSGPPRGGERALVVVGEQFRQVRPVALQRLQPLCHEAMLLGAGGARELPIGNVANEDVMERIAASTSSRPEAFLSHESLPFERSQTLAHHVLRKAAQLDERSEPEGAADDRGGLQEAFLLVWGASSRAAMRPWTDSGKGSFSSRPS